MPGPFKKLSGIINNTFGFDGGSGSQWKYDGTTKLQARNAADDDFVNVQVLDPLTDDDAVTLRFHNANAPAGVVSALETPFAFGDQGGAVDSTAQIPAGAKVHDVIVNITTAFDNGGSATFEVGDTGDPDSLVVDGDVKDTKIDQYDFPQYFTAILSVLRVTLGAGTSTVGAGTATAYFSEPKA